MNMKLGGINCHKRPVQLKSEMGWIKPLERVTYIYT